MAKVHPASLFASISGKLSKRDKSYVRTNKHTGRVSIVCVENPQWLKENDPKRNGGTTTREYQAMLRKYKSQHDIGNIFAFVSKHYKDGEIQSFL